MELFHPIYNWWRGPPCGEWNTAADLMSCSGCIRRLKGYTFHYLDLPVWVPYMVPLKDVKFTTFSLPSLKLTVRTWKWMVGILVSFWDGLFSDAMLFSGGVMFLISIPWKGAGYIWKKLFKKKLLRFGVWSIGFFGDPNIFSGKFGCILRGSGYLVTGDMIYVGL